MFDHDDDGPMMGMKRDGKVDEQEREVEKGDKKWMKGSENEWTNEWSSVGIEREKRDESNLVFLPLRRLPLSTVLELELEGEEAQQKTSSFEPIQVMMMNVSFKDSCLSIFPCILFLWITMKAAGDSAMSWRKKEREGEKEWEWERRVRKRG